MVSHAWDGDASTLEHTPHANPFPIQRSQRRGDIQNRDASTSPSKSPWHPASSGTPSGSLTQYSSNSIRSDTGLRSDATRSDARSKACRPCALEVKVVTPVQSRRVRTATCRSHGRPGTGAPSSPSSPVSSLASLSTPSQGDSPGSSVPAGTCIPASKSTCRNTSRCLSLVTYATTFSMTLNHKLRVKSIDVVLERPAGRRRSASVSSESTKLGAVHPSEPN